MNGIVIAATSSNVGKTSITLGLMQLMKRKGYDIYPFKVGPDYIDPAYHKMIAGRESYNLDEALMPRQIILDHVNQVPNNAFAVCEGVMGLFDGVNVDSLEGSSANMSVLTGMPIILIVDGRGQSQSIAATVKGFMSLYDDVKIAGVIINRINTKRHFELLEAAITHHCKIPCIGYVPTVEDINFKSRHLGLFQAFEIDGLVEKIDGFADVLEESLDIDLLCKVSQLARRGQVKDQVNQPKKYRLGLANDEAFTFYYPYNLEALAEHGCELVSFSPLHDQKLPDVDGLYIGGGYPELYAKGLEANASMRESIRQALNEGMPCYAECGGYMYLNESIEDLEGNSFKMVDFFHGHGKMTKRLQRFGYVSIQVDGQTMRGHEFHRSIIEGNDEELKPYDVEFLSKRRQGNWQGGVRKERTLAGYPHIHFASGDYVMDLLMDWMKEYKELKA